MRACPRDHTSRCELEVFPTARSSCLELDDNAKALATTKMPLKNNTEQPLRDPQQACSERIANTTLLTACNSNSRETGKYESVACLTHVKCKKFCVLGRHCLIALKRSISFPRGHAHQQTLPAKLANDRRPCYMDLRLYHIDQIRP